MLSLLLFCALYACDGGVPGSSAGAPATAPSPRFTNAPPSSSPTVTVTVDTSRTPPVTVTPGSADGVSGAPAVLSRITEGPDSGNFVLSDLATGTSQFARGALGCFTTVTRHFLYLDNCGTFSRILQVAPDTGEVVRVVASPVQTKAMIASPDDRFLYVAWQDCPGNWMCRFPSGVTVYRIPEFEEEVAAGFQVPGTVCRMFFVGETLLVVSAPAPGDELPPEADPAESFVVTSVRVRGDAPWSTLQRIVRGSLSSLHVGGVGPIDATGTCHVCCWY